MVGRRPLPCERMRVGSRTPSPPYDTSQHRSPAGIGSPAAWCPVRCRLELLLAICWRADEVAGAGRIGRRGDRRHGVRTGASVALQRPQAGMPALAISSGRLTFCHRT
jgi:hypothetical protein